MSAYSDLSNISAAASLACANALGLSITYNHRGISEATLQAKLRSTKVGQNAEDASATWEIPRQTDFPPEDGKVWADLITNGTDEWIVESITDYKGQAAVYFVETSKALPVVVTYNGLSIWVLKGRDTMVEQSEAGQGDTIVTTKLWRVPAQDNFPPADGARIEEIFVYNDVNYHIKEIDSDATQETFLIRTEHKKPRRLK